ncbi:MAG: hypothetical protein V4714_01215 [Bacteroidota bacterium]
MTDAMTRLIPHHLADCQARSISQLEFHLNVALTAINLANHEAVSVRHF